MQAERCWADSCALVACSMEQREGSHGRVREKAGQIALTREMERSRSTWPVGKTGQVRLRNKVMELYFLLYTTCGWKEGPHVLVLARIDGVDGAPSNNANFRIKFSDSNSVHAMPRNTVHLERYQLKTSKTTQLARPNRK